MKTPATTVSLAAAPVGFVLGALYAIVLLPLFGLVVGAALGAPAALIAILRKERDDSLPAICLAINCVVATPLLLVLLLG